MAFVPIQYLQGFTTTFTTDVATAITMDSASTAILLARLGVSGDFTTVVVTDGTNTEWMELTGVVAGSVTVTRAIEGSTAVPLAAGATVTFVYTETSILAIAPGGTVSCSGSGAVSVTGGPAYHISAPIVSVNSGAGINVSGGFPSFTVSSTVPSGPQGATGPAGPATAVTGSGTAVVTGGPATYNVAVPITGVSVGSGLTISGTGATGDPYVIVNAQTQGGTGTVTNLVAGAGITISGGTPTINPTVSLTPTGVGAGTYGGVQLNIYGQVVAIASGFVTGITTSTTGLVVATPTVGNYTINATAAAIGTQGMTTYAASTSAASNNPADATHSVTPAGINAVINALSITPATFTVSGSQAALSAATYTTPIGSFTIPVSVATGKTAIVDLYVEVADPGAITVVPGFAIGLFNGGSLLAGNTIIPSALRNLKYLITGPLTAALTVNTTTLAGTNAVANYYAVVTAN